MDLTLLFLSIKVFKFEFEFSLSACLSVCLSLAVCERERVNDKAVLFCPQKPSPFFAPRVLFNPEEF